MKDEEVGQPFTIGAVEKTDANPGVRARRCAKVSRSGFHA